MTTPADAEQAAAEFNAKQAEKKAAKELEPAPRPPIPPLGQPDGTWEDPTDPLASDRQARRVSARRAVAREVPPAQPTRMQGTGMGMAVGEDPIRQRLLAAQREENVKLRHNNFELNAKLNEAVAREAKLAAQLDEARASRDDAVARLATSDAELSRLRDELALSRTTPPATGG